MKSNSTFNGTNRGQATGESGFRDLFSLSTGCGGSGGSGGSRQVGDCLIVGHVGCLSRGIGLNNSCSL
jgi:hypothetical protein